MSHACGDYSVEGFLRDKGDEARALFERFEELVAECGPYEVAPAKTRVAFMVRMRFASVNAVSARGLRAHVVLRRRLEHPRFTKIDEVGKRTFVHHFRASEPDELDDDVRGWLRESYRVGEQRE